MSSGQINAPDGARFVWDVQCLDCALSGKCRHDCGHPGSITVVGVYHLSGEITARQLQQAYEAFEVEHCRPDQLPLF